jgi:trehalose 6-phosphate phosphatase
MVGHHSSQLAGELLLLDLDGTLLDIASRPDSVVVDPKLISSLHRLFACDPLSLVVVTGRALADADRLLAPLKLATIASHGAQVRVAGTGAGPSPPPIGQVRPQIEKLCRPFPGLILEWKPFSAAIHYRDVPSLAKPLGVVLSQFVDANRMYRVQEGRRVFEIVPSGISKKAAVQRLMQHLPYSGRQVLYIGDDRADHDAMLAVEAAGGAALKVGGEYFSQSSSQFRSPSEVRSWLAIRAEDLCAGTEQSASRCISEDDRRISS